MPFPNIFSRNPLLVPKRIVAPQANLREVRAEKSIEVKKLFSAERLIGKIEKELGTIDAVWKKHLNANNEQYNSLHAGAMNPYVLKQKFHTMEAEEYQFVHFLKEIQAQIDYLKQLRPQKHEEHTTRTKVRKILEAETARLGEFQTLFAGFVARLEEQAKDRAAKKIDDKLLAELRSNVGLLEKEIC